MNKCLNHNSGQALLELAVFGSIILFCLGLLLQYGLRMNYNEFSRMANFRKALALAVARSQQNTINRYNQNINFMTIQDKSIPNPADPYGIKERYPYISAYSVVYSNKLSAVVTPRGLNDRVYLPGRDIVINEGAGPGWLHADGVSGAVNSQVGYTTAGWGYLSNPCNESTTAPANPFYPYRKKIQKWSPDPNSLWWEWKEGITCGMKDEDNELYVQEGASLDIDGDYVEETLVAENQILVVIDYDEYTGQQITTSVLDGYYIIDPNKGDIDTTYGNVTTLTLYGKPTTVIQPYKNAKGVEINQGLQSIEYNKTTAVYGSTGDELNTHSIRIETPREITNIWGVRADETISRQVLLNDNTTNSEPPAALIKKEATSVLPQDTQRAWTTAF